MITALYSLVGLISLTGLVLSIALYESKNFSTFLSRKFNVCAIIFETLLTVDITEMPKRARSQSFSSYCQFFLYFEFQTLKTYSQNHWNIFRCLFFSWVLLYPNSFRCYVATSVFCLFVCLLLLLLFFRSALFSLSLDQANSLGKHAIIKN